MACLLESSGLEDVNLGRGFGLSCTFLVLPLSTSAGLTTGSRPRPARSESWWHDWLDHSDRFKLQTHTRRRVLGFLWGMLPASQSTSHVAVGCTELRLTSRRAGIRETLAQSFTSRQGISGTWTPFRQAASETQPVILRLC